MTHPGFPGGVRTGTRPISGAAPLLQQIFSCSGSLAAWVASEFWPSPYAGVCTARFVLYVQMYIPALFGALDACPSTCVSLCLSAILPLRLRKQQDYFLRAVGSREYEAESH